MRTKFFFILLLIPLVSSCKKTETDTKHPADITGNWEWVSTYYVYPTDPITPQSSGIQESMEFINNNSWIRIINGIQTEGTFSLGHGSYLPYAGATRYVYDSVVFYQEGSDQKSWDYYKIFGDTLQFCPGLAGKLGAQNSFVFPTGFNGSKFLIMK
jgi:hypothetical protein